MIYCIMFSGYRLTKPVCDCLFRVARQMAANGKRRQKIVHDDCDGFVRTEWESGSLGDVAGLVFKADVATSKGETRVSFIVRTGDLDLAGADWYTAEELRELMRTKAKKSYEWN